MADAATIGRQRAPWPRILAGIVPIIFVPALLILGLVLSDDPPPELMGSSSVMLSSPSTAPSPVNAQQVHFLRWAPDIKAGMRPPHNPRGACPSCHTIITALYNTPTGAAGPIQATQVATRMLPAPLTGRPCLTPAAAQRPITAEAPAQAFAPPRINTRHPAGVQSLMGQGIGPTGAPGIKMLPFQEVHWQGIEVITFTPSLARILKIPPKGRGVVIDEVTMPADVEGFLAGDLITAIDQVPTPDLEAFATAANRVRDRQLVKIQLLRKGQPRGMILSPLQGLLGNASGETAPMIRSGSRAPHGYMGPCTKCHHIGSGRNLQVDLGDTLTKTAPPIRAGQASPHQYRGRCSACHTIR